MGEKVIFIGGAHGVGKTTVCQALSKMLNLPQVTAGALIREGRDAVASKHRYKNVADMDANQALLLEGLRSRWSHEAEEGALLLLDGHFALLDLYGNVVSVPGGVRPLLIGLNCCLPASTFGDSTGDCCLASAAPCPNGYLASTTTCAATLCHCDAPKVLLTA